MDDFAPSQPDRPVGAIVEHQGDDGAVLAYVQEQLADAENLDAFVSEDRAKALAYYLRMPMGGEREGRSRAVSEDVYQVVEGLSTAIANIFVQAKNPLSFSPRSADDVEKAEQRTNTVKYVFFQRCNGFLQMVQAIKDGVLQKTGYLTWRWEKNRVLTSEEYRGVTPLGLAQLTDDNPNVRVVKAKQVGMSPTGEPLLDVTVHVINEKGAPVVEAVPPEEVLVTTAARSADLSCAPTIIRRMRKTRDELLRCGYAPDVVEQLNFSSSALVDSGVVRNTHQVEGGADEARVYTGTFEHDFDGDGIVELRRVTWSDSVILENVIAADRQIAAWTPILQPHEFFGRCPADDATQAQEISTALTRQVLDNAYAANNPFWRVDARSGVNVDDFYDMEIGRVVRAPKDAAEAIQLPFVAQHTFPVLEYIKAQTENTTGFTRYSQGLDANALNQTARGISIITNMSQQKVKLMAQMFGELCLKPALKGIARMLSQYGEEALSFRLDGTFVQIDPREWSEEFDMTCDVGLGAVDPDQQLMHLQAMSQAQAAAVQGGGLGKIVTLDNLYNVQVKIAENAGFRDASFAWTKPQPMPPMPPPPNPEEIKQQAETQREQMRLQADAQRAQFEATTQERIAAMKAQSEERIALHRAQLDHEARLGIATISAQAQPNISVDAGGAMSERADALQAMLAQQAQAVQQALAMGAQAQQALAETQQAVLAAIERLSAPRELVRDANGRATGTRIALQ